MCTVLISMTSVVEFEGAEVTLCNYLSRTRPDWDMSFPTGQDQTPKFAGQVLPDRTESGLIYLDIYHINKQKKHLKKKN